MYNRLLKRTISIILSAIMFLTMFTCCISVSADSDINLNNYSFPLLGKTVLVNSIWGYRLIKGEKDMHDGVDLNASEGSTVLAWKDGEVVRVISNCVGSHYNVNCTCGSSRGNYIVIYHGEVDGVKIYSGYAHLSKILVKEGDKITQGQTIGKSGNTGRSTGPHLHFEIYNGDFHNDNNRVNPTPYIGLSNTKGTQTVTNYSLVERVSSVPNVSIQVSSNTKIKVSWSSSNNIYTVQEKIGSDSWKTVLGKTKKTSYTFSKLTPGKKYSFRVKSFNNTYSEYSSIETFTSLAKVKNATVSFTKENQSDTFKSNSTVKVTWSAVTGATEYEVYRKVGSKTYSKRTTTTGTSFTDTKLIGGKKYKYKIRAIDGNAKSDFSDNAVIETLKTPKINSIKGESNTSITIKVKKVSGATSYRLYQRLSTSNNYSYVASSKTPSFKINNLKKGQKYFFRVAALKNNTITARSAARSFQSLAKCEITECLLENNTSVKLKWDKVAGASKYTLKYSNETDNKTYSKTIKGTSVTINKLLAGKKYSFTVRAVRGKIYGDYSSKKIAKPIGTPKISYIGLKTIDSALIKWGNVSGANNYKLYRKENLGNYQLYKTFSASQLSFIDTSLKTNTVYYYYLVATQGKNKSAKSNIVNVKRISGTPVLSVVERDNSSITLNWSVVDGVKGYKLYRKTDNGSYVEIKSFASKTCTYEDATAVAGKSYIYAIKGYSGEIYTSFSNAITYKPLAKPVMTSADFTSITSLIVKWQNNSNADGYILYSSTDDGEWTQIYSGDKTSYTAENVSVISEYKFRIKAYYVDNNKTYYSAFSNTITSSYKENLPVPVPSVEYSSGDTWVYAVTSESDESDYMFQYAYSTSKNGQYVSSNIISNNEYRFTGLKCDTEYYFKVRALLPVGKDNNGKTKYLYGDYTSPKKVSTHTRYTYETYTDVIDLGHMFGTSPTLTPSKATSYSSGCNVYIYSASELKAVASNYITRYKNAIAESGGTYTESSVGSSKVITFTMNQLEYYLGYNNSIVVISDTYSEVTDLI